MSARRQTTSDYFFGRQSYQITFIANNQQLLVNDEFTEESPYCTGLTFAAMAYDYVVT